MAGSGLLRGEQDGARQVIEAWRVEHPAVGFTRVVVGNCSGGEGNSMTEFSSGGNAASRPRCIRSGLPTAT
ncbi:hypothetical protein Franean1_4045 [Parafrankia sp. EAN1pec]|nr:hypothetical protein Franean1_4045 [Frankia sp. EAN1pec]